MMKCPKCGKRASHKYFKVKSRPGFYFECSCGWNNKPKDLLVPNNSTEINNKPTVGTE